MLCFLSCFKIRISFPFSFRALINKIIEYSVCGIVTYSPLPHSARGEYTAIVEVLFMVEKELGKRIKELRNKTGLSQEKFALSIGMDRTYLASVEAGRRNISIRNIKKIADGLGVSLSELFEKM